MERLPHPETYDFLKDTVVHGEVQEVLKNVPNESVHLTFTSPPYYNARAYSQYPTYKSYLLFLEKVFRQIHRVTKEGRFLVVNSSPVLGAVSEGQRNRTRYPIPFDMHQSLQQMGWEFIDDIIWQKPEWIGRNRNAAFGKHRKPLSYKPNTVTEYVLVYRKKTERPIDWNLKQYDPEIIAASRVKDGFESSNIWELYPASHPVHSAIFPSKLAQRVIEYYSLKGDLVFDPFGGTGTTGQVANTLGRSFFMAEKKAQYFEYMKEKLGGRGRFLEAAEFKEKSRLAK